MLCYLNVMTVLKYISREECANNQLKNKTNKTIVTNNAFVDISKLLWANRPMPFKFSTSGAEVYEFVYSHYGKCTENGSMVIKMHYQLLLCFLNFLAY